MIEEKKDKRAYSGEPDPQLLAQEEEKNLFDAMATANDLIKAELERERFMEAMTAIVLADFMLLEQRISRILL